MPEHFTDGLEHRAITCVTGKVQAHRSDLEYPSAPQAGIGITGTTPGEMLCRHAKHFALVKGLRLPPGQFDQSRNAALAKPVCQSFRHTEHWMVAKTLVQCPHCRIIEMIVMVVRNKHDINGRQVFHLERGWRVALWSGKGKRAGALGKYRVGEYVTTIELVQE